jgi:hypothetical protein
MHASQGGGQAPSKGHTSGTSRFTRTNNDGSSRQHTDQHGDNQNSTSSTDKFTKTEEYLGRREHKKTRQKDPGDHNEDNKTNDYDYDGYDNGVETEARSHAAVNAAPALRAHTWANGQKTGHAAPNSDEQNNTSFTSSAEQRKQSEQSNRAETMQEPATGGMAPGEWGLDSARQRLSARSNGKMSVPISNTEASASRMSSQKNQPVAHDGMAIKERIEMLEAVNTALMRHVHEMAWEAHVSNANQFSQRA